MFVQLRLLKRDPNPLASTAPEQMGDCAGTAGLVMAVGGGVSSEGGAMAAHSPAPPPRPRVPCFKEDDMVGSFQLHLW